MSAPKPIVFDDPDTPPIYGYLPHGRYKANGEWKESTPCQPSIIVMGAPDKSTFCMYQYPPGAHPPGKNEKQSFGKKVKNAAKNLEGTATQLMKEVPKGLIGGAKSLFGFK